MKNISFAQVLEFCDGEIICPLNDNDGKHNGANKISGISIDSRTCSPCQIFLAIRGENFDGHDFIEQVIANGCAGIILNKKKLPHLLNRIKTGNVPAIAVDDTLVALQNLARNYKHELQRKHGFRAIAITGSNGKTTVKDLIAAILSQEAPTCATPGNFNNHIGLPLSILSAESQQRFGVFELGMNHPGEIKTLAEILQPDTAIITNVGTAHLEFMGTREAIAREKASLLNHIPENGTAILNAENDFHNYLTEICLAKNLRTLSVSIGKNKNCDIFAENVNFSASNWHSKFDLCFKNSKGPKRIKITAPAPGTHFVINCLLASATAHSLGISPEKIKLGIENAKITGGRLKLKKIGESYFIDDTYNANPDSITAGLKMLAEFNSGEIGKKNSEKNSKKIIVLGHMAELGTASAEKHAEVGKLCQQLGFEALLTIGDEAHAYTAEISDYFGESDNRKMQIKNFANAESTAGWLRDNLPDGSFVYLKGSRQAKVEQVINFFTKSKTS